MKKVWALSTALMIGLSGCMTTSLGPAYADSKDDNTLSTRKKARAMNHYLKSVVGLKRGEYPEAIEELRKNVDTLIVVSNDKLLQIVPDNTPVTDAFLVADDVKIIVFDLLQCLGERCFEAKALIHPQIYERGKIASQDG